MTANPVRQYLYKLLFILPLTFLFAPLFYTFFGFHPEIPFFSFLVYLWHTLFIFIAMSLAVILKKYKYIAYILIIGLAFLCKNIVFWPGFNFEKVLLDLSAEGEAYFTMPLEPEEIMAYSYMLFVTSGIAGIFGVYYSSKTAFEFVNKRNTLLYTNIYIIIGGWYIISGIMGVDKNAAGVFAVNFIGFIVSYFIVHNFAQINREVSVYGEAGAYSVSGTKRIYLYYFSMLILSSVVPIIVGIFVIPFIVNILEVTIRFIIACIIGVFNLFPEPENAPKEVVLDPSHVNPLDQQQPADDMLIYYIIVAVFFVIVITLTVIFRKQIIKAIKDLIVFLKSKINLMDYDKNQIISQEIITEAKKEKNPKSKYKDYLKQAGRFTNLRERFLFAYNYIFWKIIKHDENLKESATPNEVAEAYQETENPSELYQSFKYGLKDFEDTETLKNATEETETFIQKFLNESKNNKKNKK